MAPDRLPSARRVAAWLLTGPVGHGAAAAVDITLFATAMARERLAGRLKGE